MELSDFATSEKLTNFSTAFNKLQGSHMIAKKNAENPHFRSTYANLLEILEVSRQPLTENGFSVLQAPLGGVEVCRLLVRIIHSSGEWVQWVSSTPITKKDPQGMKSAVTYLRRYNLTAALGIAEDDDDGEAHRPERGIPNFPTKAEAQRLEQPIAPLHRENVAKAPNLDSKPVVPYGTPKPQRQVSKLSEKQIKRLYAISKANDVTPEESKAFMASHWGLNSALDLDRQQYDELIGAIEGGYFRERDNGLAPSNPPSFDAPPFDDSNIPF